LYTAFRLPQDEAVCVLVCVEVFVTKMTGIPPSFSAPSKLRHDEEVAWRKAGEERGVWLQRGWSFDHTLTVPNCSSSWRRGKSTLSIPSFPRVPIP
jgi:hypothetical protein